MRQAKILSSIFLCILFDLQVGNAGRYYDARIARWTTPDAALRDGDPQTQIKKYGYKLYETSPYNYSFNNPILYKDPNGNFPWFFFAVAAAYITTKYSGDQPGGTPSLATDVAVFGAALSPTVARSLFWSGMRNPATIATLTPAAADALAPPGMSVSPLGSASNVISTEAKGISQTLKVVEGLMSGVEKFTGGQLKMFEKQLAKDGVESVLKSRSSLIEKLAEHVKDLEDYEKAGGFTSKTQAEIRNFQQQINAIDEALRRQNQ